MVAQLAPVASSSTLGKLLLFFLKAGSLTFAKLDVDANPATARDFQVVSIPTMILFKDGEPVKRIVGAKGKAALLRELSDVV